MISYIGPLELFLNLNNKAPDLPTVERRLPLKTIYFMKFTAVRFYDLWVFFLSDKRQCIIKNAAVHYPILAVGSENLRLHWRVQSTRRSYAGPPARLGTPAGTGLKCSPGACHVSGIPSEPRATSESSGLFCTDYLGTLQSLKYSARSYCLQCLCVKEKRHNNYPLNES